MINLEIQNQIFKATGKDKINKNNQKYLNIDIKFKDVQQSFN